MPQLAGCRFFAKIAQEPGLSYTLAVMFNRIAIVGGPGTGKTTLGRQLAKQLDIPLIETDDDIDKYSWNAHARAMVTKCTAMDKFIIEGVIVASALRAGLVVDYSIWLPTVHRHDKPTTNKQRSLAKAVRTVYKEWL